jgi:hypothetical protein
MHAELLDIQRQKGQQQRHGHDGGEGASMQTARLRRQCAEPAAGGGDAEKGGSSGRFLVVVPGAGTWRALLPWRAALSVPVRGRSHRGAARACRPLSGRPGRMGRFYHAGAMSRNTMYKNLAAVAALALAAASFPPHRPPGSGGVTTTIRRPCPGRLRLCGAAGRHGLGAPARAGPARRRGRAGRARERATWRTWPRVPTPSG